MTRELWDASKPPVYGCLTGLELPNDSVSIVPGIRLTRVYVDTFGATMMAFVPPLTPKSHHPAPWAAVRGGFNFEGRVQVELSDMSVDSSLTPSVAVWLVAAVLRLRVPAPIRLAVIANIPFNALQDFRREIQAVAFESATHQIGPFAADRIEITERELSWLRDRLPIAAQLYHDERFFRAFSIYDQSQWAPTAEVATVLVWTAIEILFDLAGERDKTKAICAALSEYVGADKPDRDRAYQVIRDLYYKRGQTVHAGRRMASQDVGQSFRFASVAFQHVLVEGKLPVPRRGTIH